jgi:5'(3')-deoxyribonucleotidase
VPYRPTFLTDSDEVLGAFQEAVFPLIERLFGRTYRQEDFTTWDIFEVLSPEERAEILPLIRAPGFCQSIKPYPEAQDAIREIRSFAYTHVVTAPFSKALTWMGEREEWLCDHFGFEPDDIYHARRKANVWGDAFLDDKPTTVQAWSEKWSDGVPMLWHIPNTRTYPLDHFRVTSWDEVIRNVHALTRK